MLSQATTIGAIIAVLTITVIAFSAVVHALLYKRRPRAALAWIIVCLLLPIGGLLYFVFGINRVKTRMRPPRIYQPKPVAKNVSKQLLADNLQPLARLGMAVTSTDLIHGNKVTILHNGEQAYPAMFKAIEQATAYIYLASYIFETNATGRQFIAALSKAHMRGVDICILLDGMGELYSFPRARRLLRKAGLHTARFLPWRWFPPALHFNLRNHRKILLIDGIYGFTGGMNIGDRHLAMNIVNSRRVVDIHFQLEGPILTQLAAIFIRDWEFATGEHKALHRTSARAVGDVSCRAVSDGPDEDLDRLPTLLLAACGLAQQRIALMTPYFLPPREIIGALQAAALRGVDVAIILPALNNLPYVHRATRHMLWELLRYNIHIYYQPPPFVHSKLFLIDDGYAQIGSANIDPRSLRLNFELNIEIYQPRFVATLSKHFESVRSVSQLISFAQVESRRLSTRLADGCAWLFSPYL